MLNIDKLQRFVSLIIITKLKQSTLTLENMGVCPVKVSKTLAALLNDRQIHRHKCLSTVCECEDFASDC
ncbi:hypothetical protein T06_16692 [Trichinella sp. T6]|nr:hypothetical protein T06_16692 [Trichinella sp. T6]